jgi:Transposase DDE domain.
MGRERVKQIEREKGRGKVSFYPNSLMNMLAAIHAYLLPYRQIEGFLRVFAEHIDAFKRRTADYTTVWWRVAKVKVDIDPNVDIAKDVTIAVDSTGIKVSNRGIREKWYGIKRRGFIKFHIAVDVKTGKILAIDVTKENVSDGARAIPLI